MKKVKLSDVINDVMLKSLRFMMLDMMISMIIGGDDCNEIGQVESLGCVYMK